MSPKQKKKKLMNKENLGDFPGSPVVKKPLSNAGGMGLMPGWGTKIPRTTRELSPPACRNYRA